MSALPYSPLTLDALVEERNYLARVIASTVADGLTMDAPTVAEYVAYRDATVMRARILLGEV